MFWEISTYLLLAVYIFTILTTVLLMLLENRSPVKSIAWIIVLLLFPGIGLAFYILVGRNFRKKRVISRRSLKLGDEKSTSIDDEGQHVDSIPSDLHNLAALAYNNSNAMLYPDNDIKIYTNGSSLFDDIFEEIAKAKKFIHIEYYVFNSDEIGSRLIDALIAKAKEGVSVRLIIDDVGSWMMKKKSVKLMREAGIQVFCFLRVGLPFMSSKVNYRNHRKILVIDGLVGFTGGMNVADRYVKGTKWGEWRDTHLRITGSGVHGLQKVFSADWFFVSRVYLKDDIIYYPVLANKAGNSMIQIVQSGPDTEWESIMQVFFMAIAQARKSVYIETPYFLPNNEIVMALQTAAMGGVDVKMILPRKSDAQFALLSSCSYIDQMLKAGVKVYYYEPGFIHSKTIVVDGKLSTVGSANMDFRSFEQNFEVNTFIYDEEFASRMQDIFNKDLAQSTEIDVHKWSKRPKLRRLKESFARLFSPLM